MFASFQYWRRTFGISTAPCNFSLRTLAKTLLRYENTCSYARHSPQSLGGMSTYRSFVLPWNILYHWLDVKRSSFWELQGNPKYTEGLQLWTASGSWDRLKARMRRFIHLTLGCLKLVLWFW